MTKRRGVTLDTLRERREQRNVDMEWRREYLRKTRAAQFTAERDQLRTYIERMNPACRALYLKHRLSQIKKELQ